MALRRVAVIGAGISGLASAYYLQRNSQDTEILIFESESTSGGKLVTSSFAGLAVDEGADSFLAGVPWAFDLCIELGLVSELVSPSARWASLWLVEKVQSIPSPNVLGVPLNIDSIPEGFCSRSFVKAQRRRIRGPCFTYWRPKRGTSYSSVCRFRSIRAPC